MNRATLAGSSGLVRLQAFASAEGCSGPVVRELSACVRWLANGALMIRYRLDAELERLRIAQPGTGGAADGLWRHSCFEAFVALAGAEPYHEFNFSPSAQWAVYRFSAWRVRDHAYLPATAPLIRSERSTRELMLEATVPAVLLPGNTNALRLGLCAVIEHADGTLEYQALCHPAAQPDFHHRGGFVLELAPPAAELRDD